VDEKMREIDKRIEDVNSTRRIKSLKQMEIMHLRFRDHSENMDALRNMSFKKNCDINEKHIALNALNHDRKVYLTNLNDRQRAKATKEKLDMTENPEIGGGLDYY